MVWSVHCPSSLNGSAVAAIGAPCCGGEVFLLRIPKRAGLADLLRVIPGVVSYAYIDAIRNVADNTAADALEIEFLTSPTSADESSSC